MVESYLLTELPLAEVARRCCLPPATVDAFESLFFACREHLAASDWILTQAVGAGPWNTFAGGHTGAVWKYMAYAAGPNVLEVVVAVTTDRPLPAWVRASCPDNPGYGEERLRLLCKLALGAMTTQSDEELKGLVEARERLLGLDHQTGNAAGEDQALSAMEQFLKGLGSPRALAPGKKARAQEAHPKPRTRGHNPSAGRGPTDTAPWRCSSAWGNNHGRSAWPRRNRTEQRRVGATVRAAGRVAQRRPPRGQGGRHQEVLAVPPGCMGKKPPLPRTV
jgi:hypothetical protein